MTRVLVLGGSGFIGRNLTAALAADGCEVVVTSRREPPEAVAGGAGGMRSIALDFSDAAAVAAVLDDVEPDLVIHLVSSLIPASGIGDYHVERESVIGPTMRLVEELAQRGIRLVYFSSGGAIYGPSDRLRMKETDPLRPIGFHGYAKQEIESYVEFAHRTMGLRHLIVRPSNPFGRHQSLHGAQGLISVVLGCAVAGRTLEIWGDGGIVRDYIHIDDLCAAVLTLIGNVTGSGIVNIGSGVGHTVLEVVDAVRRVTGRPLHLAFKPARPVDTPRAVLDIDRARSFGVADGRSLEDGIAAYVEELSASRV